VLAERVVSYAIPRALAQSAMLEVCSEGCWRPSWSQGEALGPPENEQDRMRSDRIVTRLPDSEAHANYRVALMAKPSHQCGGRLDAHPDRGRSGPLADGLDASTSKRDRTWLR
jgi:hypothetical protein